MTLTRDRIDAPMALQFGKAKWLAVLDDDGRTQFVRNLGMSGRWVAEALAAAGVTDVVAPAMGENAFKRLSLAGVRVWKGELRVAAADLAREMVDGRLPPIDEPEDDPYADLDA